MYQVFCYSVGKFVPWYRLKGPNAPRSALSFTDQCCTSFYCSRSQSSGTTTVQLTSYLLCLLNILFFTILTGAELQAAESFYQVV